MPMYSAAQSQITSLRSSSDRYKGQLATLQGQITSTVGDLTHPHFVLWNSCDGSSDAGCSLTPGYYYAAGVPDTFTYDVSFHSTVPVAVWIMTTHDFACWASGNCAWTTAAWWPASTDLQHGVFHDAEGCAGYLAIFKSARAGVLYPDVSITRNSAPTSTGACA